MIHERGFEYGGLNEVRRSTACARLCASARCSRWWFESISLRSLSRGRPSIAIVGSSLADTNTIKMQINSFPQVLKSQLEIIEYFFSFVMSNEYPKHLACLFS